MEQIRDSSQKVQRMIGELSGSMSRQVSKAVEHVNELTQTAASSAEEMSGATEELSHMANELRRLVGQYKTATNGLEEAPLQPRLREPERITGGARTL
jgi:methyl-accepting chemotaxis protein